MIFFGKCSNWIYKYGQGVPNLLWQIYEQIDWALDMPVCSAKDTLQGNEYHQISCELTRIKFALKLTDLILLMIIARWLVYCLSYQRCSLISTGKSLLPSNFVMHWIPNITKKWKNCIFVCGKTFQWDKNFYEVFLYFTI